MKKLSFVTLATLIALLGCGDKSSKDKAPEKTSGAVKESAVDYLSTARLITLVDSVKEINEVVANHYTWVDAVSACPSGYRLPTVDEFKKMTSRANEFTRGNFWWTANVTDQQDSSAEYAGAIMATLPERATEFQFKVSSSMDIAKVTCLQDTTGNKIVVNESAQKFSSMEGTITGTKLTPYYQTSLDNMGCSDCCCEEGNGGTLNVSIQTENGSIDEFQIKELSDSFCGALSFDENNTPKDIQKVSDGCTPAVMENFRILQLFQPDVKIKRISCTSSIYLMTPTQKSREEASCGETITLDFYGKIQDMALAHNDDPEAEKECNYSILIGKSDKPITTRATCSNAEIGKDYTIQVTITLDPVTSKDASPIVNQEFPCCYGEIQSHQITGITFTPVIP